MQRGSRVILVYDSFHQGAQLMLDHCEKMLLVGKPESYYRKLTARTQNALGRQFRKLKLETVDLPLSLGEHSGGEWGLEELVHSNLTNYVSPWLTRGEEEYAVCGVG